MKGVIAVACMLSASVCAADKAAMAEGVLRLNKEPHPKYENYCSKAGELRAYWSLAETKKTYSISFGPGWVYAEDFYEALVGCVPTKYAELEGDLEALKSACVRMIPLWGYVPSTSYIQMIEFFLNSYRDERGLVSIEEHKDFK